MNKDTNSLKVKLQNILKEDVLSRFNSADFWSIDLIESFITKNDLTVKEWETVTKGMFETTF